MSENAMPPNSVSKSALLRSIELRNELHTVESKVRRSEAKIAEVKSDRKRMALGTYSEGHTHLKDSLLESLAVLRNEEDVLSMLCEQRDHLALKIASLNPTREQIEERGRCQRKIEKLVMDRVAVDRKADEALAQLQIVLRERAALTGKIMDSASSIDLEIGPDRLDAQRFDEFADSLPKELSETGQRWADWFTGTRKTTSAYIVCTDPLILPETLACSGVYHFGDSIDLTTEEAAPLLCGGLAGEPLPPATLRSDPRRDPPSIATVEAFEAATAKAAESGMSVGEYLFHVLKTRGVNVAPHSRFSVTIEAQSDVKHDGRTYSKGEKFETSIADAVNVIETGAARPLSV